MPSFKVDRIDSADSERDYAWTPMLDPSTGDRVMRGPTWKPAPPLIGVAVNVLRTDAESYPLDKSYGAIRYSVLDKLTTRSARKIEAEVENAFKFLTDAGLMKRLKVTVQVMRDSHLGAVALLDLSFFDPRSKRNYRISGKF